MAGLQELHTPAEAAQWLRVRVTGTLATDSRQVQAGDGFIAWPGAATDGRRFVNAALGQGARACLVALEGAQEFSFQGESIAGFAHLKEATGPIAAAYFEEPSKSLDVIAITGTNGKTSTAWWLAHALSNLEPLGESLCGLAGTLGICMPTRRPGETAGSGKFSFAVDSNGLTTPDPVRLQRSLRDFVSHGLKACALEASSIGIAEHRLDGTSIRVAVFTNFTQDHLDYHGSMQSYWQAKSALFDWPLLQAAVINVDDEKGAELALRLKPIGQQGQLDIWTVSCRTGARLQATDIAYDTQGLRFTVREAGTSLALQTSLIGDYNVSNLLGVIGAMRALGVPLADCVAACATLQPVPGRMQCLGGAHGPLVAVDYAHTPDALAKALTALRPMADARGGQLWCVFGCGGNRDAGKRPLMGAIASRNADRVLVTSDNPRDESPQDIIDQITAGLTGPVNVEIQTDRARAIADAVLKAGSRDVVLVAGKGHEDYQEIKGLKLPFSDEIHIRDALAMRQPVTSYPGIAL